MAMKQGRPTFYKDKMIRRTYQITAEQDKCIKEIAKANGESESSILRLSIDFVPSARKENRKLVKNKV